MLRPLSHTSDKFDIDGSVSPTNAYISPQWGGVRILDTSTQSFNQELDRTFAIFATQLSTLLGVPPPAYTTAGSPVELQSWRTEALLRSRILESVQESVDTLAATTKLAREIANMRIGHEVRDGMHGTLKALDEVGFDSTRGIAIDKLYVFLQVRSSLSVNDLPRAMLHAADALRLSSEAFFHPTMLALLYFPDEHKWAVYTPLFGPIALPLIAATVRETMAVVRARKAARLKVE